MKILLMSSHTNRDAYNCPHLGLYRLKHLAELKGNECGVLDASLIDIDAKLKVIKPEDYDIIGISISHNEMKKDLETITFLNENKKENKPLIIAGGQEATYNGKQWLKEGVDLIFTGYAEESFCNALDNFKKFKFYEALSKTKKLDGIMYIEDNSVVFNPNKILSAEEFEKNNHNLVLEADIPYEEYWEKARKETIGFNLSKSVFVPESVRLYTSSSCPYNCGFCNSSNFITFSQQKIHRPIRLNAGQIYEQILHHIKKYGAKCFMFNDDEPFIYKQRINELCQKVIEAKENGILDKEIMFNSQGRVTDFLKNDDIDYGFIDNLKKAGFHSIGLGVETLSDRLLKAPSMNKKGFNSKDASNVSYSLLKGGIIPHVFTILFIPEATPDDIKLTISRGMDIFSNGGQIVVNPLLRALPGGPIYKNDAYLRKIETLESKISGEKIEISKYYIPQDPFLADCAEKINEATEEEISAFENRWRFGNIPKAIAGTLTYIATAKLLKERELANKGYKIIDKKIKELENKIIDNSLL